jgi:dihydroneopterin aldolase
MLTVSIEGLQLKAPIGIYPQEAILHNEIEITMHVSQKASIDALPFIDYTQLHQIALQATAAPTPLLETVLQRIVTAIAAQYPDATCKIIIRKLHPPMPGSIHASAVQWESQL